MEDGDKVFKIDCKLRLWNRQRYQNTQDEINDNQLEIKLNIILNQAMDEMEKELNSCLARQQGESK